MDCQYHPGYKAIKTCEQCGAPVCQRCAIDITGGHTICHSCFMKGEERDAKWLRNFKIIAIIGILLFLYILYLGISKKGSSLLLRSIIVGGFVGSFPMAYFYMKTAVPEAQKAQIEKGIQIITTLIIGPFLVYRAVQYYKMLENRLKRNKEIEGKIEDIEAEGFIKESDEWIADLEFRAKELEIKYNVENMRKFRDISMVLREIIEDSKRTKVGQNGKIKDEILKEYEEKLEKIERRRKALEEKYPSSISSFDKLSFQKVNKIAQATDEKKREKTKEEEEHTEKKRDLYIEVILDMESKLKKIEENYNVEDMRKYKADTEFWFGSIRCWKLKHEGEYARTDSETLEILEERLKKLEERIEKLESKYQNI